MAQEKVNPYVIKEQNGELPMQGWAKELQDLGLIPDEEDGLDWKSREAMEWAAKIVRFCNQLEEQWRSTKPAEEYLPGTIGWAMEHEGLTYEEAFGGITPEEKLEILGHRQKP